MQLSKDEYTRKKPIMVVWCKLKVPSLRITVRHHSESLAMLNSYRRDRIFNAQFTAIKKSYNKVNVRTFVTHEYEIFFVHTYVTYENVIWLDLCYTQKIWYLSASALFLHMKMCNVLFVFFYFLQNLDRCISKCSKSWEGQIHLF